MRILAIINALVTLLHTALCYDTNINNHYLAGQTTNSQPQGRANMELENVSDYAGYKMFIYPMRYIFY